MAVGKSGVIHNVSVVKMNIKMTEVWLGGGGGEDEGGGNVR